MTNLSKFWPLDYEPEDEIYENPSWDLPGLRRTRKPPFAKRGAVGNPKQKAASFVMNF
jgi:hypothetical protein